MKIIAHTDVQWPNTYAVQHWFWKNALPTVNAALQNRLTSCLCHCNCTYQGFMLIQVCRDPTPMECSTGFGKMHSPLFSVALQNRLTACLCHCNCTYQGFMLIQVCKDLTPMQCNTGFARMHSPLFSAALQNMLTVTLSHSNCTCEDCCSYRCAMTSHLCNATLVLEPKPWCRATIGSKCDLRPVLWRPLR